MEMKKPNALHGPPIDAYIIPDTDEHQVINYPFETNYLLKKYYNCNCDFNKTLRFKICGVNISIDFS